MLIVGKQIPYLQEHIGEFNLQSATLELKMICSASTYHSIAKQVVKNIDNCLKITEEGKILIAYQDGITTIKIELIREDDEEDRINQVK